MEELFINIVFDVNFEFKKYKNTYYINQILIFHQLMYIQKFNFK